MDCIDKLGMTLSMKLMRMCGCSGLEKILLNPKSEVRGMYFGTVCSVFGGCQVGSRTVPNHGVSVGSMLFMFVVYKRWVQFDERSPVFRQFVSFVQNG